MIRPRPALATAILTAALVAAPSLVAAHGERNQEPFLRMRTIHWYDVEWSAGEVAVNHRVTIRGKLRVFSDWPKHLFELGTVYLNLGTTGPVFIKVSSRLNGVPMLQSTTLEYGRDYAFELVIQARVPGRHHVHPLLNVEGAGPLVGPGKWVEVSGSAGDFVYPLKTLDGIEIPNLENWKIASVARVHLYWLGLAFVWLGWWVRRRPLLLPRFRALAADEEASLVGRGDRAVAAALLVIALVSIAYGAIYTNSKYPRTSALQAGRARVFPLPREKEGVTVFPKRGIYEVPGRSLVLTLEVTNGTSRPVRLGEFTAANLRFVNRSVAKAVAGVPPGYPGDLVARSGLVVKEDEPIAPGETRTVTIEAADAAWETERLASLMGNPDSSYGALLLFFDDRGKRFVSEVSGPAIPAFTRL